jgi:hypothetical protein
LRSSIIPMMKFAYSSRREPRLRPCCRGANSPIPLYRQPSKYVAAHPGRVLLPSSNSVKADVESEAESSTISQSIHRCPDVL